MLSLAKIRPAQKMTRLEDLFPRREKETNTSGASTKTVKTGVSSSSILRARNQIRTNIQAENMLRFTRSSISQIRKRLQSLKTNRDEDILLNRNRPSQTETRQARTINKNIRRTSREIKAGIQQNSINELFAGNNRPVNIFEQRGFFSKRDLIRNAKKYTNLAERNYSRNRAIERNIDFLTSRNTLRQTRNESSRLTRNDKGLRGADQIISFLQQRFSATNPLNSSENRLDAFA